MNKYIVLAFLLVGCGSSGSGNEENVERVKNCTTYESVGGSVTTEYCDITITPSKPSRDREGLNPFKEV